jgi:hypothetical protein
MLKVLENTVLQSDAVPDNTFQLTVFALLVDLVKLSHSTKVNALLLNAQNIQDVKLTMVTNVHQTDAQQIKETLESMVSLRQVAEQSFKVNVLTAIKENNLQTQIQDITTLLFHAYKDNVALTISLIHKETANHVDNAQHLIKL